MVSLIDFSKPIYGTPTTESVRDNFEVAQEEITDLQVKTNGAPFLPLSGGTTMTGLFNLYGNPTSSLQPATKQYVDGIAFGGTTGVPPGPADGWYYARGGGSGGVETTNDWSHSPIFSKVLFESTPGTPIAEIGVDATYSYLTFDINDQIQFERSSNILKFLFGGVSILNLSPTGGTFNTPMAFNYYTTLNYTPSAGNDAVNKTYVDAIARNSARLQAEWPVGSIVNNGTIYLSYDVPYNGIINSLTHWCNTGSFTAAVQINGTNVTGLGAIAPTSTPATTNATAARTFTAGQRISVAITGASPTATDALLSLNVVWS